MKVDDIATAFFDAGCRQALTLPHATIAALVVMITDALARGTQDNTPVPRDLN